MREDFLPAFAALVRLCFQRSVRLGAYTGAPSELALRATLKQGPDWAHMERME